MFIICFNFIIAIIFYKNKKNFLANNNYKVLRRKFSRVKKQKNQLINANSTISLITLSGVIECFYQIID